MTTANVPPSSAIARGEEVVYREERRSGWLFFAGSVMGLAGLMRIVDAIWAFNYDGPVPRRLQDGIIGDDLDNYAWLWLGVGILLLVCSFLILERSQFARWVGLFAAAVAAITAMTWMPYYPIWSLVYVGIAVLVFYALARYGGPEPVAP
jgi:hypothetical protein